MTSVCNVTLTSNDGGSPCVQTCASSNTVQLVGCPPGEDHLTFHPGVTLLLSHSNSSFKFKAEAGIVTALGRARCWYRLRGMINIVLELMYALQVLIHTYIGCWV